MPTINVPFGTGIDRISTALATMGSGTGSSLNDATAGDRFLFPAGTYTFTGAGFLLDHNGLGNFAAVTGPPGTLVLEGVDRDTVIIDFAGCGSNTAIYGGTFSGVTIKNMTFKNVPAASGAYMRDASSGGGLMYKDWTFENIKMDGTYVWTGGGSVGQASPLFKLGYTGSTIGTGITFKDIVTTATFGGVAHVPQSAAYTPKLIDFACPASNLDLTIDGIDVRLNNGYAGTPIFISDLRDANIRGIQATNIWGGAVRIESLVNGNYDFSVDGVFLDNGWDGGALTAGTRHESGVAQPGVHIGNSDPDNLHITRNVHCSNINIRNNASYGFEYENDTQYCSLVGFYIYNCNTHGLPIPDEVQHCLVSDGIIDTIRNASGSGMTFSTTAYCTGRNVLIKNCPIAFNYRDDANPGSSPGGTFNGWAIRNLKNNFTDCTIIDCGMAYSVLTAALTNAGAESSAYSSNFENNSIYGTPVFSQVDGVAKNQDEFEALFPHTMPDGSNTYSASTMPTRLTIQGVLNELAGSSGVSYSIKGAANRLIGETGERYTIQDALNMLLAIRGGV